jgi:hypothetical protein
MGVKLLNAKTDTGAGAALEVSVSRRTFQLVGSTSAGAGAASVNIEVSNDGTNWLALGNIALTLATTAASDGFTSEASWTHIRGNVVSISGTGASVTLYMGAQS